MECLWSSPIAVWPTSIVVYCHDDDDHHHLYTLEIVSCLLKLKLKRSCVRKRGNLMGFLINCELHDRQMCVVDNKSWQYENYGSCKLIIDVLWLDGAMKFPIISLIIDAKYQTIIREVVIALFAYLHGRDSRFFMFGSPFKKNSLRKFRCVFLWKRFFVLFQNSEKLGRVQKII